MYVYYFYLKENNWIGFKDTTNYYFPIVMVAILKFYRSLFHLCLLILRLTNCKMEGDSDSIGQGSNTSGTQEPTQPQNQHHQFLGDASTAIPNFEDIDTSSEPLPEGVTPADVRTFQKIYREHAEVRTWELTFSLSSTILYFSFLIYYSLFFFCYLQFFIFLFLFTILYFSFLIYNSLFFFSYFNQQFIFGWDTVQWSDFT